MGFHMARQRRSFDVSHYLGHYTPSAFHSTQHDGFPGCPTTTLPGLRGPNVGFVRLNDALEVNALLSQEQPDLVSHPPRAFVGDTDLALEFLGRNAILGIRH